MWNPLHLLRSQPSSEVTSEERELLLKQAPVPCLWLFGKTGSGKTSLIRYLTGASNAEIGSGFRPQTRQSQMYGFPDDDMPVVRFLDTRGLGEAGYDAAAENDQFSSQTHLMIITVRATDQATSAVTESLAIMRRKNPGRPTLLVITCLHDAYPGEQHIDPDPFGDRVLPLPSDLPDTLRRSLEAQVERFDGLFDRAVAVDLTQPEDGFDVIDFGGDRLKRAILDLLPAAYRQTLLQLEHVQEELSDQHRKRSDRIILAHSIVAASAAAVPAPWVDIPIVMATQSHLLHRLAADHGQEMDAKTVLKLSGVLGGRVAMRMGIRELLKFIPWVGMAVNAAAAFAFTFGSGKSASWYFRQVKAGHIPSADELREVYSEQLKVGAAMWKTRRPERDQ